MLQAQVVMQPGGGVLLHHEEARPLLGVVPERLWSALCRAFIPILA